MNSRLITYYLTILLPLAFFSSLFGGNEPRPPQDYLDDSPLRISWQFEDKHPVPNQVKRLPGPYYEQDWPAIIDATWGPGWPLNRQNDIWLTYWNSIDDHFACFHDLDPDVWQNVYDQYTPQVDDSVSRGRLSGIISHAGLALQESHTWTKDLDVYYSDLDPGVPLLVAGAWGHNGHFGAGLTVLPDTNLLVYKAVEAHPLGLVPGDIVLGYDGVPWKQIYQDMLAYELPITGWWWGSNDYSFGYSFQISCGMNWHLFETIDIIKYASGDTLHLGTSALEGEGMSLWATEQMDIPGVEMPDFSGGELTSWGIVDGTNIGYIYNYGWYRWPDSTTIIDAWLTALDSLQNFYEVDGLILDFRTNYGADVSFAKGLNYFFDTTFLACSGDSRWGGYLDLIRWMGFDYFFDINGENGLFWDTPMAILTGPGAISGGDFYPMILAMHPLAKVFGRPTAGAYNLAYTYSLDPAYNQRIGTVSYYIMSDSGNYLTRKTFPSSEDFPWVDFENVWLTQEGVVEGRDDVVEAAISWINTQVYICGDANGDGGTNLADAGFIVNYIFYDGPAPDPMEAGDANADGGCNLGDAGYIINYIFYDGPEPVCP